MMDPERKSYILIEDPAAERHRHPVIDLGASVAISVIGASLAAYSGALSANASYRIGDALRWERSSRGRLDVDVDHLAEAIEDVEILDRRPGDLSLIEASPATAQLITRQGLNLVEDQPVYPASARPAALRRRRAGGEREHVEVLVFSARSGQPCVGATVVGRLLDDTLDSGITGKRGVVRLDVTGSALRDVWVDPVPGHWSWAARRVRVVDGRVDVPLEPLAPGHIDALRRRYATSDLAAGEGVVVGVIDTGIAEHPALEVSGGRGYELGSRAAPYTAGASPHGTHVAGVVASRDAVWRGIAPGVSLRSYRIYEGDSEQARMFTLVLAITDAMNDGCDIINLSLELKTVVDLVKKRVREAIDAGVIVVAAAGNEGRAPISFPASVDGVVAVAAVGRRGTFPPESASADHAAAPPGADPDDFVADFSNRVRRNDFAAPGVGSISTVTGGGWGVMDGTSQAAPVLTGLAARVLQSSGLLKRERSLNRAQAVITELRRRAASLGFPADLEGKGLVKPMKVTR